MKPELFIALDVPDIASATRIVNSIWPLPCGIKIGLELMTSLNGPAFAHHLAEQGWPVFIDMKLNDIPTTVERTVANIARLGATFTTVVAKDSAMLTAALRGCTGSNLRLLATTVLSSDDSVSLYEQGHDIPAASLAQQRAAIANKCGVHGIVTSGNMLADLRNIYGSGMLYCTPGLRNPKDMRDDQHHVLSPKQALQNGSNILVAGRMVTRHHNPGMAVEKIMHDCELI